jgi:enterobactin synthetase component D
MKSEENVESILDFAPCTGAWLSWPESTDDEKPPKVHRKRQLERSLGRHAALLALRALCGDSMTQVHIGQDADGCPIWPQGVVGSISHSQLRAVAVVSHRRSVESIGVDLEKIRTQNGALAQRVLRPEDFPSLLPDMPLYISVSIYFSIRESFYKCLFPILRRPLDWQDCFVDPGFRRFLLDGVSLGFQ